MAARHNYGNLMSEKVEKIRVTKQILSLFPLLYQKFNFHNWYLFCVLKLVTNASQNLHAM